MMENEKTDWGHILPVKGRLTPEMFGAISDEEMERRANPSQSHESGAADGTAIRVRL